jgi:hypothetical protein
MIGFGSRLKLSERSSLETSSKAKLLRILSAIGIWIRKIRYRYLLCPPNTLYSFLQWLARWQKSTYLLNFCPLPNVGTAGYNYSRTDLDVRILHRFMLCFIVLEDVGVPNF